MPVRALANICTLPVVRHCSCSVVAVPPLHRRYKLCFACIVGAYVTLLLSLVVFVISISQGLIAEEPFFKKYIAEEPTFFKRSQVCRRRAVLSKFWRRRAVLFDEKKEPFSKGAKRRRAVGAEEPYFPNFGADEPYKFSHHFMRRRAVLSKFYSHHFMRRRAVLSKFWRRRAVQLFTTFYAQKSRTFQMLTPFYAQKSRTFQILAQKSRTFQTLAQKSRAFRCTTRAVLKRSRTLAQKSRTKEKGGSRSSQKRRKGVFTRCF